MKGEYKLVQKAILFAKEKHKGQEYNGKPYYVHPFETAEIIKAIPHLAKDENLIAAAILHDVTEDCGVTYEELKKLFNEDIASLVREVTKSSYNTFPNLKTQRGICLKLADRLDNVSHMHSWSEEKKQKYLDKTKFWKS